MVLANPYERAVIPKGLKIHGLRTAALHLGATATRKTHSFKDQQGAVSPRCKSFKGFGVSLGLGKGSSTQSCSF